MLNQTQTIERQAALPAASPRPRALAFTASPVISGPSSMTTLVPTISSVTTVSAPPVPSEWSQSAPISATGLARVSGFGAGGYAAFAPRPMAGVRTDSAVRREGNVSETSTSSKQQDQKHLTARRGPVTWRPPH